MTSANLEARGAGPETPPGAPAGPDPRRWAAFVIMTVAVFMDMLDGSVVNVALPTIQRDVDMSYAAVQWVTAGYVLAFALLLITGGRLGDIYGRRRMFLIGVAGFTVASLVCGLAGDAATLIGARLLQGAMAGLMVPQVLSIIHVTFPDEEKGKVYALHGGVGGIAATIAPLVGGLIVAANLFGLEWRPIFLVNVPIGIVGLFLGAKFIGESRSPEKTRLDIAGVVLSAVGLLLLLVPLTFGRDLGWPAWSIAAIVASVVVLVGFVAYERAKLRRGGAPLIALNLFRARSFSGALVLTLAVYVFTGMFMLALYLYAQLGLGWSALHTGLTLLAFAFGAFLTATASVIALVPKFGRTVLQIGSATIAVGVLLFFVVNGALAHEMTTWTMAGPLFVIGLGFGATATPISMFGLSEVPMQDAGSASGLLNTKIQLGFALGIAATSLSFFLPLTQSADDAVNAATPQTRQELVTAGVPADRVDAITTSFHDCALARLSEPNPDVTPAACVADPTQGVPQAAPVLDRATALVRGDTFADAFQVTLLTGLGLAVLAFVAAGLLPRRVRAPGAPA